MGQLFEEKLFPFTPAAAARVLGREREGKAPGEHEHMVTPAYRIGSWYPGNPAGQQAEHRRAGGGDEPAHVVAERRARAPQSGREELREVDGVAAEERELAEPHERDEHEDLPEFVEQPEREGRRDRGQEKGDRERGPAADPRGDIRERVDPEERAGVLHQRGDPRPVGQLAGDLLGLSPWA